jgi:hypothetical protein
MRQFFMVFTATIAGIVVHACSSGGGGGAGPADGGPDTSLDVAAHPYDSAVSGGDDSSAPSCPTPADVSKWTPPAYKPAKHVPGACSSQALSDFDKYCLNSASASTANCNAFKTANATCVACLVTTTLTDATWGPLFVANGTYQVNLAGCLELAAPGNTSCQAAMQAAGLCLHAACDGPCPVTTQATLAEYHTCTHTAETEGCSQYVTAANCVASIDASAAQACIPAQTQSFDSVFLGMAPYFCGPGGDGGVPEGGGVPDGGGAHDGGGDTGVKDAASGG